MSLGQNAVYGIGTVRAQHGDQMSFGERAGAFTAGAVTSAWASFYNTGVAVANAFGAEAEELDIQQRMSAMDRDWGQYYAENKELIDLAGFVGGSFAPGALGMKAMQLAKAGKYGGAVGRAVSGKLNVFAEKSASNLAAGLKEIASEGGTAFAFTNRNKLAAMGWNTADKALEVAAGEIAIAATMKQSPLLADDSWGEVAKDLVFTSALGGGLLGGIGAFSMNKLFKDTVRAADAAQRKYDVLDSHKALRLDVGDKVYGLVDSLLALPDEALAADKVIKVNSPLLGGKTVELDLSQQLKTSIARRNSNANIKLQELFLDDRKVDKEVGVAIGEFVVDMVQRGKRAGADGDTIKRVVGEYMFGLKGVHGLDDDVAKMFDDAEVFYVNTAPIEATGDVAKDFAQAMTRVPSKGGHITQPYRVVGDATQLRSALIGVEREFKTIKEAFEAGADMAVLADNTVRINPESRIVKQLSQDPAFSGVRYLNTRTGAITEEAIATAADVTKDLANKIDKRGVNTAKEKLNFDVETWYAAEDLASVSTVEATARHAWLAKHGNELIRPGVAGKWEKTINATDVSALSFIRQRGAENFANISIDFGNGNIQRVTDIPDFAAMLRDQKAELAMMMLAEEGADVRSVAYKLNMSEEALAKMTEADFRRFTGTRAGGSLEDGFDLPLTNYLKKENVVVRYDTADALPSFAEGVDPAKLTALQKAKGLAPEFIDGELGFIQRVKAAEAVLKNAAEAVTPDELRSLFQDIDYKKLIALANQLGGGASTLGMSNANYNEALRMFSQNTGKLLHRMREIFVEDATSVLQPHVAAIQADATGAAAAELGVLTYAIRGADEPFVLWFEAGAGGGMMRTLVPARAVKEGKLDRKVIAELEAAGRKGQYELRNKLVGDFAEDWIKLNRERIDKRNVLLNARGYTTTINPNAFYAPAIDTTKFSHFALVKDIEGRLGASSEVVMVVARDAKELQQKVAQIPRDQFEVYFKENTEKFFKVKGMYDQQQTMNSPRINSELRKAGVLTDYMPSTKAENVLADYVGFANNSWSNLARETVETRYGQLFEQLRFLGKGYTEAATSQVRGNLRESAAEAVDPFQDLVRTALDLSKRSQYRLLSEANEFVDMLGTRAYRAIYAATDAASKGQTDWQTAARIAKRYGVGGAFEPETVEEAYRLANIPYDRNLFRETISKVNTILANTVLRLDAANTVIQTISTALTNGTELASIRSLAKADPEFAKFVTEATTVAIPGTQGAQRVPSTWKLLFAAGKKYFTPEGKALRAEYYTAGDIKGQASIFHSMMDDLALPALVDNRAIDKLSKTADKYVELGAKWSGNNFAEEFSRFISANIMDQLTAPAVSKGLLSKQEAAAMRSIFVNRTQGNYITSQRPIVFQGTVGAAVGLFQTYAFTLLQNLARHVENRDARALLTFAGLQTTLFGMNGLPFFEAVNTHVIGNAATNDSHSDIYTTVTQAAGKEMGDWLMYGTASAFPLFGDKMPALYTRGDVNPRYLTVIPVLPTQVPAVDASIRIASNIWNTAGKLAAGGDVKNTLLEGLEHNGVSRPLAGIAQALNGYSSTSKGGLIAQNNDLFSIANASRILGAKPVDEAVMLNTLFRQKAYDAKDAARLEFLGEAVKTKFKNGEMPTTDELLDFQSAYASVGGRVQNYSRALQRWQKDSTQSVVNQALLYHETPEAQRMLQLMEGQGLDDAVTTPAAD
jgi:hypothetical protein